MEGSGLCVGRSPLSLLPPLPKHSPSLSPCLGPAQVCYFVNSGSEANDMAITVGPVVHTGGPAVCGQAAGLVVGRAGRDCA